MSPSSTVVVAALLVGCAASFTSSPALFQGTRQSLAKNKLYATTLEPPTSTKNKNGATAPPLSRPAGADAPVVTDPGAAMAESREATAATSAKTTTTLDVRIHDIWYDLSKWRTAHPAGSHWIDYYDKRDATEVMDAFHSAKARQMYQRLPHSKSVPENVPAVSAVQRAFRALQVRLEEEGYWERNMVHEATQLSLWASCVAGAVFFAQTNGMFHNDVLSISLLGMSMTAAGWLGHDYIHGVDDFANRMRNFAALAAGLTPTWWSDKHNKHHALTNEKGVDEDIATDPFLYTWAPDPSQDSPLRKIQHLTFWIPFSMLFALWRVDTFTVTVEAVEKGRAGAKQELYCLLAHYAILFTLFPLQVWLPAVFLSGLISALIVTPTHQSEELFDDFQHDWVTAQFRSTRNAATTNPFSEWIWGGMQYQLEHHLFPSMPRHHYPSLQPILEKFATDLQIPGGYRVSNEWDILRMNWETYRSVAQQDAVPGAPLTKGRPGQQAAICETNSPAAKPIVAMK